MFFKEGENCWKKATAERIAFLVDGEDYYRAVAEACEAASHSIYILGWDVDSRICLRRGADDDRETFGKFIDRLAREKPDLHIYILEWDFAMLYSLERETWSLLSLGWMTHERVTFALDDNHPVGASHHQKIVVVDDKVAFTGGFDLASYRWDSSEHRPDHPGRVDNGNAYGPVHDVQVAIDGDAAKALSEIARERWERATGDSLPAPPDQKHDPWPASVASDLEKAPLAILRTQPQHDGAAEIRDIEHFYVEAIRQAKKRIYIENQYFTSHVMRTVLEESLAGEEGPDILIVLPCRCPGWLEEETMGLLRRHLLSRLRKADRYGRLKVCYPFREGLDDDVIIVHSKLMVVDEQLLTVGSANLSNRSMAFDTECNIALDAAAHEPAAEAIAAFRNRLLAEHLGTDEDSIAACIEQEASLFSVLGLANDEQRSLREMPIEEDESLLGPLPANIVADPESPMGINKILDYLGFEEEKDRGTGRIRRKAWRFFALIAAAIVLAMLWRWSPLSEWLNVEKLLAAGKELSESPMGIPVVLAIYLVGSCLMFPVNLLILATALTFGPFMGFGIALSGSLLGGLASYLMGHWLGRDVVEKLAGKKINRISRKLARRGWLAVALIRVVPVAPYTVVNMVAGATHITARSFLIGTAIGLCPGIIAIMIFEEGLQQLLHEPDWYSLIPLGIALLFAGAVLYLGRRWIIRQGEKQDDG